MPAAQGSTEIKSARKGALMRGKLPNRGSGPFTPRKAISIEAASLLWVARKRVLQVRGDATP